MNQSQLFLDRSLGTLKPYAFARAQHKRLVGTIELAPRLRFDGGERAAPNEVDDEDGGGDDEYDYGREHDGYRLNDDGEDREYSLPVATSSAASTSASASLSSRNRVTGVTTDSTGGGSGSSTTARHGGLADSRRRIWAHQAGVNALATEHFDDRWLISGGADASIKIWDLQALNSSSEVQPLKPYGAVAKGPTTHKFGITHLSFYPFDSLAFLSSSADHTLKLYSTSTLTPSASFNLDTIIYTHALSPIATHLLVACATQHPSLRLIDLRSGAATHALPGHTAALLSTAWSPTHEHVLASGSADGSVRLWDVRRSNATLGLLDLENSVGVEGFDGLGTGVTRVRHSAKAHVGAVNALEWTSDGAHIVTAGHDSKIRVWDAATGANTLASFGPLVRNGRLENVPLLISPSGLMEPGREVLWWGNGEEIFVFELLEGKMLKRMRAPGEREGVRSRRGGGERGTNRRIMAFAWRGVEEGFVSGHSDGCVRAWGPRGGSGAEEEEAEGVEVEREREVEVGRKRKALEDIYRDLTRGPITFG